MHYSNEIVIPCCLCIVINVIQYAFRLFHSVFAYSHRLCIEAVVYMPCMSPWKDYTRKIAQTSTHILDLLIKKAFGTV